MAPKYVENRGLLTREESRQILAPYIDGLTEDLRIAWEWVRAVLDQDPERRGTLDRSTQAAMVFNRFVTLTQRRFDAHPIVKVKKLGRLMTINFGGGLLLRFKKFDAKLRSHNVKTNQQAAIYYQLAIPGMDPATRVTFGYTTDVIGQNLTGIYLTCPTGWSENKWVDTIHQEPDSGALPFAQPAEPDSGTPGFALEPKEKKEKKSEG